MAAAEENPLLSTARASDTSPNVQLHPLVLLTISDYITRHSLRQQQTPIIGAIIGQQDGRTVTMEVAFECRTVQVDSEWVVDDKWFTARLDHYRDVFKVPQLDLVGWFSIGSNAGPQNHHVSIHNFFQIWNESALFLLFRPESVADSALSSGKLPLSIYESFPDSGSAADNSMDVDGAAAPVGKSIKFSELSYTVETSEAEMISVDFVARGGGNATAVDGSKTESGKKTGDKDTTKASQVKGKGKGKESEVPEEEELSETNFLSAEDEELLASITAKTNAIRMLHKRIQLLQTYLSNLQQSYLADASIQIASAESPEQNQQTQVILRAISALLARLPILAPADTEAFVQEAAEIKADVALVDLLSSITNSVQASKELGRKFAAVNDAKRNRGRGGFNPNAMFQNAMEGGGAGDLFGGGAAARSPYGIGGSNYV